jgi:hypothetical protein
MTHEPIRCIGFNRYKVIKRFFKVFNIENNTSNKDYPVIWYMKLFLLAGNLRISFK